MTTMNNYNTESHSLHDTFNLKMKIKASLFTGKGTVHLSNVSENSDVHPYDFYIGTWMGNQNEKMHYTMLSGTADGSGIAQVTLPILSSDTNHAKFGVFVQDPNSKIMRHIASSHKDLLEIASCIEDINHPDDANHSILLKDNYSKNQVLIHLANDGTDIPSMRSFCAKLQPSILKDNDSINQKVIEMSFGLHNWIEKSSCVSNMNGGPNFVNSMCFLECMGCAINYPLLDMTYSSERHRVPLSMLAYSALATLRYVNMTADHVMALDSHDFMKKYVMPLCKSFTICSDSMVYAGDKTLDVQGNLDMATEDFAMVLSKHMFENLKDSYSASKQIQCLGDKTDSELQEAIMSLRAGATSASSSSSSRSHMLICDDCETLSGLIKSFEGSIYGNYLKALATAADSHESAALRLADMMWEDTRDMESLRSVPKVDFEAAGKLLARYGQMRKNRDEGKAPCAQMGVSIVSAKGASFALGKTDLNGHACVIGQTLGERGDESYTIGEGTANMKMLSLPANCPEKISMELRTGEKSFGIFEALNTITQNLSDILKTGEGKVRIEQNIPGDFNGKDPYKSCPFYMAGFFVGLEMGPCTPGVIPLQSQSAGMYGDETSKSRGKSSELAACDPGEDLVEKVMQAAGQRGIKGNAPVFGAPIADLSADAVSALPIDLEKVMGGEMAKEFLEQVKARNNEVYPPRASDKTLKMLMSRWLELEPSSAKSLSKNADTVVLSTAEGFKCADMARAAVEYKKRIARKFNALQAEDPKRDGVVMDVHGYMMSAVAQFSVPYPVGDKWELSCVRNLRKAVAAQPFRAKTAYDISASGVGAGGGNWSLI